MQNSTRCRDTMKVLWCNSNLLNWFLMVQSLQMHLFWFINFFFVIFMMIICETSIHCSLQDNQPSFFLDICKCIILLLRTFCPYSNLKSTNTTVFSVSPLEVDNWNYSYTNDYFLQFQCIRKNNAYLKKIDHSNLNRPPSSLEAN